MTTQPVIHTDLCHCLKPAAWRLLMIPVAPSGRDLPAINADDQWSTCDDHIAEAARRLLARESTPGTHRIELRGPYGVPMETQP